MPVCSARFTHSFPLFDKVLTCTERIHLTSIHVRDFLAFLLASVSISVLPSLFDGDAEEVVEVRIPAGWQSSTECARSYVAARALGTR
jgi:hypothetical protein